MEKMDIIKEIKRLKVQKNAVILAHSYQVPEVQDIADHVGDSLALSRIAAETDAETIVFCGVYFMAESAKILSPDKKVLLTVIDAGCPMADMIDGDQIREFKMKHPGIPVACYVNSSAEVKAECDIAVTSSNALKVISSLDSDKLLFVPDQNLGHYIASKLPNKEIICWQGFCITHHRVTLKDLKKVREVKSKTKILVHPECNPEVVAHADFVGSTSEILKYAKENDDKEYIIGTEMGILHQLKKDSPSKKFYMLSSALMCHNMKKTSLRDVYEVLKYEKNEINVDRKIMEKARKTLKEMLKYS